MYRDLSLENLVVDGEVEVWVQVNTINELENVREWYWVSSFGRVKSFGGRKDKIMKQCDNSRGYLFVGLQMLDGKRKTLRVNRLVAFAFVSGYEDGLVCNHLDEQKKNNHYLNLEWCTIAENNVHGTRTERTSKAVIGTCVTTGEVIEFESTCDAGRNGFNQGAVSSACRGEFNSQHKHGGTNVFKGYRWKYAS